MTHCADEAGIVPAVAQGFQEAVAGIDLEVTAVTLGAKHLLVVCGDRRRNVVQNPVLTGSEHTGGRYTAVVSHYSC